MTNRTKTARNPAQVIEHCPACGSRDLIRLEVDAICGYCDWDSTAAYVAAGGMDNLFRAAAEHFRGSANTPVHAAISSAQEGITPILSIDDEHEKFFAGIGGVA